jgi:hypothetical protein
MYICKKNFLIYFILFFLAADVPSEKDLNKVLQLLEPQISFLEDLTKMGGAMRSVLTQVLTNQQNYKDLTSGELKCCKKFTFFYYNNKKLHTLELKSKM